MTIAPKPSNPMSFVPLEPNATLEHSSHERRNLTKGAFSDEARVALAMAVKAHKPQVQMDRHTMNIKYREDHVYVVSTDRSGLPCGVFNYKGLRDKEAK